MASKEDDEAKGCAGMIALLIFVIFAVIWGINHDHQVSEREKKLKSHEWTQVQLYVCSDQPDPGSSMNWMKVKEWVADAHITVTKSSHCVSPVTAILPTSAFKQGDFKQITIKWEVVMYKVSKTTYKLKAVPHVSVDKTPDENDEAALDQDDTWTDFDYDEKFVDYTFSLSIPASEIYPELCSGGKMPDCKK